MSARMTVLDVGHGNCSILMDDGQVCVIDAGKGPYASIYLTSAGITDVDLILISHADDDHLAGIIGLLSSEKIKVKTVALNSDAMKDTKIWRDVRATLESQHNQGKITLSLGVFRGPLRDWSGRAISLDALSPSIFNALSGVGGVDQRGKSITANSGSIVIRVSHTSGHKAILAADMEEQTLNDIISSGQDMSASILVFPHHGGRPGSGSTTEFTDRILDAVKPSAVLFSNGREKHDNPRPEVIARVCARNNSYIACTQLSKSCHSITIRQDPSILPFSAGADEGRSCAGTVEIDLETGLPHAERATNHNSFVEQLEKPMCRLDKGSISTTGMAH